MTWRWVPLGSPRGTLHAVKSRWPHYAHGPRHEPICGGEDAGVVEEDGERRCVACLRRVLCGG